MGPSFFMAAIDEVGRGPLAGPVVAACLFWSGNLKQLGEDEDFLTELGINDSKKLSDKKREEIVHEIGVELSPHQKLSFSHQKLSRFKLCLFENDHKRIDEINILQASLEVMENSWQIFSTKKIGKILIDGNKLPKTLVDDDRAETVVKGDLKSQLIGLSSICAKVYRDRLMRELADVYPGYGLERHAGYPTKAHKEAIKNLGVSPIHRKTFKGVKEFVVT